MHAITITITISWNAVDDVLKQQLRRRQAQCGAVFSKLYDNSFKRRCFLCSQKSRDELSILGLWCECWSEDGSWHEPFYRCIFYFSTIWIPTHIRQSSFISFFASRGHCSEAWLHASKKILSFLSCLRQSGVNLLNILCRDRIEDVILRWCKSASASSALYAQQIIFCIDKRIDTVFNTSF